MFKKDTSPAARIKSWGIRLVVLAALIALCVYSPKFIGTIVGTLLTLALLVCVAWVVIKGKLKEAFGHMGRSVIELAAFSDVLTLKPVEPGSVEENEDVVDAIAALASLGFVERADYEVDSIPALKIFALIHPEKRVYAVVYSGTGDVELISCHGEHSFLGYTNSKSGKLRGSFFPDALVVIHRDLGPESLFKKHQLHAMPEPSQTVSAGEFISVYRRYQEEFASRKEAEMKEAQRRDLELRESLLESTGWSASVWEEKRERVIYIHDKLNQEAISDHYMLLIDGEDELTEREYERHEALAAERTAKLAPRAAFAALFAESDLGKKIEKICELSSPLPTDVYLGPEVEDYDDEDDVDE